MHLIQWQSLSHPVTSPLLDKTIVDAHSSAIVLSPSLVLCCGKDGQLRLFRSHYEVRLIPQSRHVLINENSRLASFSNLSNRSRSCSESCSIVKQRDILSLDCSSSIHRRTRFEHQLNDDLKFNVVKNKARSLCAVHDWICVENGNILCEGTRLNDGG